MKASMSYRRRFPKPRKIRKGRWQGLKIQKHRSNTGSMWIAKRHMIKPGIMYTPRNSDSQKQVTCPSKSIANSHLVHGQFY